MPKFYYDARDSKGARITGEIEAEDSWLARKSLSRMKLSDLRIRSFDFRNWFYDLLRDRKIFRKNLPLEVLLVFVSELETGLSVGIPLLQLLELIHEDIKHAEFRATVKALIDRVAQGADLHEACAEHPQFFDSTFVGLIETGEVSGDLEKVLGRIFLLLEQQAESRARIKSAVFYPKIVLGFMGVVLLIVVYVVIPKVQTFLESFGQDLPPITRAVVWVSQGLSQYWYVYLLVAVGAYCGLSAFKGTEEGGRFFDSMSLRLPVMGELYLYFELNNFCVILDLLLESGIPIVQAIETVRASQNNQVFKNELENVGKDLVGGASLRSALKKSSVFPASLVSLIGIGEASGKVSIVMRRMGRHYQLQVDHKLNNLAKLIEPVLLAVIFIFTLILALAIFLPIWKMSAAVKSGR